MELLPVSKYSHTKKLGVKPRVSALRVTCNCAYMLPKASKNHAEQDGASANALVSRNLCRVMILTVIEAVVKRNGKKVVFSESQR